MKKLVFLSSLLIFGLIAAPTAFAQRARSAFAAAAAPGQTVGPGPVIPTPIPAPITPPAPGVARPATPSAAAKPEEQLRIVADPATNSLIVYGTAQEFQNIKNILKDLDLIPRQVLMDVLVAEVTLTDTESFGVAYDIFRGNTTIFGRTFPSSGAVVNNLTPPLTDTAGAIITALTGFPPGISGIVGRTNSVRAFINALATQSRVRTLASPSVLATDNRPARIQVGSEIPILTSQTQSIVANSNIVNTVQYRNTGVILTIIPQVNSQGLVHLQVKQEVSDVGNNSFGNTNSPSFTTRDAETTAIVQDGETLAIGGIITERKNRDRSGIPYLMDLPVFGRFFGTTADTTNRTELVMLITPHVVRNRDESRDVTEELKSKLSGVRNELERLNRERASERARQQPAPVIIPDAKSALPVPAPAAPMPSVPAPSRAPGVSMAPASLAPVPLQQIVAAAPVSNASLKPRPEAEVKIEAKASSSSPDAEPYAPETDAVGALLNSIETNATEIPTSAKPTPPTVKAAPVWVVQIASFVTDKEAQAVANRLRGKGYDAHVGTAEVGGRMWYRVEVGRLASRNDARELQKNLQATEKIEQSIIASR